MRVRFVVILMTWMLACGSARGGWPEAVAQIVPSFTQLHAGGGPEASTIYDSTIGPGGSGSAGLVFSTNSPNASVGDDLTFAPLPGGTQIAGVNFAFVVPANTAVPNCDAIVTFYDIEDDATTTGTALLNPLGSGRVFMGSFSPSTSVRGFSTGFTDFSAQHINFADTGGGISIAFVASGTNNILPGTTITPALSGGTIGTGSNHDTYFYLDGFNGNPLDGTYTGQERVSFGGANANNNKLWLQLTGNAVPEPAGFVVLSSSSLLALGRRRRPRCPRKGRRWVATTSHSSRRSWPCRSDRSS
jgi:hypothetical protein